jgi:hypothetical protein
MREPARFILVKLNGGHTFKELQELEGNSIVVRPAWVEESALVDVAPASTDIMQATVAAGSYAFHCGYLKNDGTLTAFWKGPFQAVAR